MFIEYITYRMKAKFEADSYEGNEATYLGMKIDKVNNGEFGWGALDSNNYEGEITHIEIYHERTRAPSEPLADDEQTILRSELGKLMRIARIARTDAIYDASVAAQTFSAGELIEVLDRCGGFRKMGKRKFRKMERK